MSGVLFRYKFTIGILGDGYKIIFHEGLTIGEVTRLVNIMKKQFDGLILTPVNNPKDSFVFLPYNSVKIWKMQVADHIFTLLNGKAQETLYFCVANERLLKNADAIIRDK